MGGWGFCYWGLLEFPLTFCHLCPICRGKIGDIWANGGLLSLSILAYWRRLRTQLYYPFCYGLFPRGWWESHGIAKTAQSEKRRKLEQDYWGVFFFLQSTLASFSKFHHFDEGLPGCTLIWGRHDLKVEGDFGGQTSNLTTTPPSKLLPRGELGCNTGLCYWYEPPLRLNQALLTWGWLMGVDRITMINGPLACFEFSDQWSTKRLDS